MNRISLFIVVFLALVPLGTALAQTCTDWTQSIGLSSTDPAILGDLCRVEGTTCYVAGADFQVIDVTDLAAPVVLGSVPLPGSPEDMLIRGDTVYLALDGYGLAEIDISAPTAPVLTRSFSATGLTRLGDIDPYLAAGDGSATLRILDVTSGPDIVEVTQKTMPISVVKMGKVGDFLVLDDGEDFVVMDFDNPMAPQETDRQVSAGHYFATDGSSVFIVIPGIFGIQSYYWRFSVNATGVAQLEVERFYDEYFNSPLTTAGGGFLAVKDNASIVLLDADDLKTKATLSFESDIRTYELSTERLVGLSPQGLTCQDLASFRKIQPIVEFGTYAHESGYGGSIFGRYWIDEVRSYTSSVGGGISRGLDYQAFDLQDPLSPVLTVTGYLSSSGDYDIYPSYLDVRIIDDRWVLETYSPGADGPLIRIRDIGTGLLTDTLPNDEFMGYAGGILFTQYSPYMFGGPFSVHAYSIDATGVATQIADFGETANTRSYLGSIPGHVVLRDDTGIHVYDYSDPADIVEVGTVAYTGSAYIYSPTLVDRTVYFCNIDAETYALEISDVTNPTLDLLFTSPAVSYSMKQEGDVLVLGYSDGVQLAVLNGDGTADLVSPVIEMHSYGIDIVGDQLYVNDGVGLCLFDISDPAVPAYVGQAVGSTSAVGAVGDYLINGGCVFLPHCPASPVADFSADPLSGDFPLTVAFSDLSSGGPTSWSWSFGDGGTSTAQSPTYTFPTPGIYTVSLTAANAVGSDTETKNGYITVTDPEATAHVYRMQAQYGPGGNQTKGECTVEVVDNLGAPVPGATVSVEYTGPTSGSVSGVTQADGTTTVQTTSAQDPVEAWCFTVTGIDHDLLPYDADADEMDGTCSEGIVSGVGPIPAKFALAQNAPNPFNPMTTIKYSLPRDSQVLLRIYNLRGQVVETLVEGSMTAGYHDAVWNAAGHPSGVYFYRIQAGDFTETRKMILLK